MREQFEQRVGVAMDGWPIWLWERRGSRLTRKQRYEVAHDLHPDPCFLMEHVFVDVDLPPSLALRTSYTHYCFGVLDRCYEKGRPPRSPRLVERVFRPESPRPDEVVQVVAPYLERSWIRAVHQVEQDELRRRFPADFDPERLARCYPGGPPERGWLREQDEARKPGRPVE